MKYLFIASIPFFLAACSTPQKAILQTWKITDVQFIDSLNTLPEKQKDIITSKLKKDIQFAFLPDSVYQVVSSTEVINGKWWFSADKKTLFTTAKEKTISSKIYELKKKGFKFESTGEDINQSFLFTCSPLVTDKK